MISRRFQPVLLCLCAFFGACGGVDKENPEQGVVPSERTYVVFSPATSELPLPNDILFASESAADGTMSAGSDPDNPVISGIDALDGNSVLAPFDISFTASLSESQTLDARSFIEQGGSIIPNPDQNVFLLPLSFPSGDGLLQASLDTDGDGEEESIEVPTFSEALSYQQAVATSDLVLLAELATPGLRAELISLDGGTNNVIRITPLKPLLPKTKYLVVITDIVDANDNPVFPNIAYETIRDPESNLDAVSEDLAALRPSVQAWEQLAEGYFGFKQTVFDALSLGVEAPSIDDILMSITLTTAGTTDVLTHIAAPDHFFESSLISSYKKSAIVDLVSGRYPLDGSVDAFSDPTDIAIVQTLNFLLSSPTLPDASANPLYQAGLAGAVAAGADYATIASDDATAAYVMQTAVAQAAIQVHDSGSAEQGDAAPYVDIASEAIGTVLALSANNPSALFPLPQAASTRFFRVDEAADINSALAAPAYVYQGQMAVNQFMPAPESEDGSSLVSASWQADENIGAVIDAATGNDVGTTPPSAKITYRYPFPAAQSASTIPLLAVLPDEVVLSNFGISKPDSGWPVVIYIHGISQDRSAALPLANALAFACVSPDLSGVTGLPCFATIAIDQPQHGLAAGGSTVPGLFDAQNPNTSIVANLPSADPIAPSAELQERHFGFTADATVSPVLMDYDVGFGSSGSLFINLSNFENARDKLRQMVIDLMTLNASISAMDVDGDGLPSDLDSSRIYVVGNSLGAVDGIPFVAVNNSEAVQASPFSSLPEIQAAAMLNTGGGLPRLLTNSVSRAPLILSGLAAASDELTQGRSGLESYLNVFQGVLDSVDPMNFASALSAENADTGILLTEMVGDDVAGIPSDTTIPNAADSVWGDQYGPLVMTLDNGFEINGFPAPLAGTEPLISEFGAAKTAEFSDDGDPDVLVTRFIEGSHGNIVSAGNTDAEAFSSAAVFAEMVSQIATFFANDGNLSSSIVTNAEVIED